jgi:SAM-dependent methyltransferase
VIGLDLSPTQPSLVPPNLSFQVADIERIPWSFAPGSFDYINCRFLAGAVVSWPALLAQCLTALRPGGYIEFTDVVEWFSNATGGSVMAEWSALWTRGLSEKLKRRVFTTSDGMQEMVRLLAKSGFETPIAQTTADIPVGSWPIDAELKKLGRTWRDAMCGGVEGQVLALLVRSEGWSVADVEVLSGNLRAELKNRQAVSNVRTRIGCCIAKKPA